MLVVVGGPFLLGKFSWMSLSRSFQIILPIVLLWLMPWHFSLCCILHSLLHFTGSCLVLVCWILVLGENIHRLWLVTLVVICRIHTNICGWSFRFLCIILLRLDVSRCNIKIELFVSWFWLLSLSVPPPVSLVPSTLWGVWLYHNIENFQQLSGVFFIIFILLFMWCFLW